MRPRRGPNAVRTDTVNGVVHCTIIMESDGRPYHYVVCRENDERSRYKETLDVATCIRCVTNVDDYLRSVQVGYDNVPD